MTDKVRIAALALSWIMWATVGCTTAVVVSGCAGGAGPGGMNTDRVTESDESGAQKRARLRLELAVAYFDKGQTTDALDHLKQSIAADPNLFEAYNLRGLIYMRLNDAPLAEESFKRALSINPKAATVVHNYAWFLCQQSRYSESEPVFYGVLGDPSYGDKAKTWMALGLCQMRANRPLDAEKSFVHSLELDASNPMTGYNLSLLLFQRGDYVRAQFYVRRINNSEYANAETLWLGIKVERCMENRDATAQLTAQLKKRFPASRETAALERGAFNE